MFPGSALTRSVPRPELERRQVAQCGSRCPPVWPALPSSRRPARVGWEAGYHRARHPLIAEESSPPPCRVTTGVSLSHCLSADNFRMRVLQGPRSTDVKTEAPGGTLTCSWVGDRAQPPPESHASLGEFAGRAQQVQGQGPCTPYPIFPFPQLYGGQCWVVLWSLPGLLVLAREYRDWPGVLHARPWPQPQQAPSPRGLQGPNTAFLTDPSPQLPHSTLGPELGETAPGRWGLIVPAGISQQMVPIPVTGNCLH